jgi:hypothetical protein
MADPQQIALKDEEGVFTVPADQVQDALATGATYATLEDYQKQVWTKQHETTGQEAATAAEGFAQGLVPGAATLESKLLPEAGSIEEQNARRMVNPGIRTTGQVAGSIGQAVGLTALTGGVGEALAGGAEAAEGLGAGAEAAEAVAGGTDAAEAAAAAGGTPGAVSAAADASAAEGPTSLADALLKNKLGGYVQQGVAGAAQGGTNYVNEAELGDHDFNGEALAQEMGLGALFGVGTEAGINVLGEKVLPPVLRKADDVLDAAGQKFKDTFNAISDKVNDLIPGKSAAAMKALEEGAEPVTAETAQTLSSTLDKVGDLAKDMGKAHEAEDGFRIREAQRHLADVPTSQVAPHLEQLSNGVDQAMGQLEQMAQRSNYASNMFKKLTSAKSEFDGAIGAGADSAELHEATLSFKQRVGKIVNEVRGNKGEDAQIIDNLVNHEIYGPATDNLRDAKVWGEAQAGRNNALDAATRQKINSAKQLAKDFGAKELDLDSGKNELYIKPSKILSTMKGDPLANQEKLQHLTDYIEAVKNYANELKTSAGAAGAVVPGGGDLEELLQTVTAARQAGEAYKPVEEVLRGTRQQVPLGLGAIGAAPLAGMAAHAAGLSIPGVAPIVAGIAALRSPVRAMQTFIKIAKTADTAKRVIGSSVRKIFSNAPARVGITAGATSALRGRTVQNVNGASAGADFAKQSKHIGELAADQNRQMNSLATNTSRISDTAPLTTASLQGSAGRQLQVLNAAMPRNPAPSALASENKEWQPNASQLGEWNEIHAAVLKPASYLGKLQDGTASPKVWAALQAAYPAWTQEVASQTMQHLTTHPKLELDPGQKLAASMILGGPISPTVAPDQIAFQQQSFAVTPNPSAGQQKKQTQHGLDKLDIAQRSELGSHMKESA